MGDSTVYKAVLLDHFHNPRNRGDMAQMQIIRRGSNPRCGDEIEVGIAGQKARLESVRFRGRGCSICLASASIMTECVQGLEISRAKILIDKMRRWFDGSGDENPPAECLEALATIRTLPARKKCVLLAWQALDEILEEFAG